uniref:MPN domain-containing protein n=1 Tax=Picea sitchensis TaxID=3332 RepID=D5A9C1_PICSI|nr:unknown [Picea sitchensis]
MLIRVRSRDGLERVKVDRPSATVGEFKSLIQSQLQVPIPSQILSTNQNLLLAKGNNTQQFKDMEDPNIPLSSLGIGHGHIVFLSYEGERSIAGPQINVNPSGSFGKKMTMDDLISRQVRIERQDKPHCGSASFDRDAANGFQQYVNENLAFAIKRGGFMYGTVGEGGDVAVNFIYEHPQQGTEDSLFLFRDQDEEKRVEAIAIGLGMRRVGFIFTQTITQGKKDYTLSNAEIRQAVELHAESELKEWVTALVKLEVNEEGGADVHFEAFQLSDQCVKLFKEGWFVDDCTDLDLKITRLKKDVVILGKDTRDVDNDFFLVLVKILDHQGPLSSTFPIENRASPVTLRALKNHLDRTKNLSFVKRISDFHLLLLLAKYLDVNADVPQLAACVQVQASVPEGYQIIIDSLASNSGD